MGAKIGHKVSKETREKISKTLTGRKCKQFSKEHRINMSKARKGIKLTEKHKENIRKTGNLFTSEQMKGNTNGFPKGNIPHNKGKKHSYCGEKHWNWKGGVTKANKYERQRLGQLAIYKDWRMSVFLRDNFTCQFCGLRGVYLEAHHIKRWCDYPELRFDIDNGVTLCKDCHSITKKGRKPKKVKL